MREDSANDDEVYVYGAGGQHMQLAVCAQGAGAVGHAIADLNGTHFTAHRFNNPCALIAR